MDLGSSPATYTKLRRSRWRLGRLGSEISSRIRGNENRENEICSGMKCVSVVVMFAMFKWYLLIKKQQ